MATYVPFPSPGATEILTDGVIKIAGVNNAAAAMAFAENAEAVGPQVAAQARAAVEGSAALRFLVEEMRDPAVEYTLTPNADPTEAPPGTWSVRFIGYLRAREPAFRLPSYIGTKPRGNGRGTETYFRKPREDAVDQILHELGVDTIAEGIFELADVARLLGGPAEKRKSLDRLVQRAKEVQPPPRHLGPAGTNGRRSPTKTN